MGMQGDQIAEVHARFEVMMVAYDREVCIGIQVSPHTHL